LDFGSFIPFLVSGFVMVNGSLELLNCPTKVPNAGVLEKSLSQVHFSLYRRVIAALFKKFENEAVLCVRRCPELERHNLDDSKETTPLDSRSNASVEFSRFELARLDAQQISSRPHRLLRSRMAVNSVRIACSSPTRPLRDQQFTSHARFD
jgi:hypothetical protein